MAEHNIPPFLRYIGVGLQKMRRTAETKMTQETYIELAEKQRPMLKRLAASFLHNEEEAEDVVQESLLRLWLLRERMASAQDFNPLAVRITKNVCISLWRQRQSQVTVPLEAIASLESSCEPPGIVEKENNQMLRQAIAGLPPSERRIFQLWRQGMSIQEISTITGTKPRTVSSMLSLARKKIFNKLKHTI